MTTTNKLGREGAAGEAATREVGSAGSPGGDSTADTKHASGGGRSAASARSDAPHGDDTEQAVIYVGMDLGTSRTAIACSNGVRESLPSLIGYPKDVVARKLLGEEILFGKDVIERRLSLDVYRPLEKGVIKGSGNPADSDSKGANGSADADASDHEAAKNMRAAKELVKYAIRMARAPADALVHCVIGAPAEASIKNHQALLEAAREVIDSVMICSEPFAVAYGMDVLTDALVIDIGAGTADLCRMHGTMPDENDQVTIDHAGDRIDSILEDLVRKAHPTVQFSRQMITDAKEKFATVDDSQGRVMVRWPVNGKPTDVDITKQMIEACHSIVPPIVEALGRLVASFDPEFQAKLRNNVILGGGGSQIRGLGDAISAYMDEHLGGGKVVHVEEPVYAGANGTLKIAKDMPPEFWEQLR